MTTRALYSTHCSNIPCGKCQEKGGNEGEEGIVEENLKFGHLME